MTYLNQFDASLWQTCDEYYQQLQPLALQLQDEHHLNVNLLLLAIWLDNHHYPLSIESWQRLDVEIDTWEQKMLQPYRKLRRLSKANLAADEYQQMLDVELMLERKAQALILHKLKQLADDGSQSNLETYLSLFELSVDTQPQLLAMTHQAA
ncbi:TIGR02444 family protein [Shewanella waksmanii]|uniref:TIGR02444 family protein n=1 Tax=Shewanella waksmanii TaxID=213783 RepID=UPI003736AC7A